MQNDSNTNNIFLKKIRNISDVTNESRKQLRFLMLFLVKAGRTLVMNIEETFLKKTYFDYRYLSVIFWSSSDDHAMTKNFLKKLEPWIYIFHMNTWHFVHAT